MIGSHKSEQIICIEFKALQLIHGISCSFIFYFFDKQRQIELRKRQTGGAPYVHRQYAKRAKTRLQKERKKLERERESLF